MENRIHVDSKIVDRAEAPAASPFNAADIFRDKLTSALPPDLSSDGGKTNASLPPLELTDFQERAERLIDRIDPSKTATFTSGDLAKLVADPGIKGQDAAVLASLYQMSSGSDRGSIIDDYWVSAPTITSRAEVEAMRLPTADEQNRVLMLSISSGDLSFNAVDKNGDGKLSATEVRANNNYRYVVENNPALSAQLKEHPKDGLSQLDFAIEASKVLDIYSSEAAVLNAQRYDFRRSLGTERDLYADMQKPLASIKMDAVHQGEAGDCYFESVLAATAVQRPELIRDAIHDNGDGSYTVTFKGDREHPVTIAAPTEAEMALYNRGSEHGIWAPVMEKAYAHYALEHLRPVNSSQTPQENISGGRAAEVMGLLTGNYVYRHDLGTDSPIGTWHDSPIISDFISDTLKTGHLATLETDSGDKAQSVGLMSNHAYSVIGFQPGANGGTMLLRDPNDDNQPFDVSNLRSRPLTLEVRQAFAINASIELESLND